jgi:tetratricopeptide (TPR) repeat protein
MLADQGREDEAVSGFRQLLASHPELPDLRHDLGMLYRKQRQWDKALAVFCDELSANPKDERAAARVSEALVQLMRWTELRDFLAPRVQQARAPLWATLDLAEALEQLGEARKAISLLSDAEVEYSSSRAVHFRLLHLYRISGNMTKAVAEANWFKSQPG